LLEHGISYKRQHGSSGHATGILVQVSEMKGEVLNTENPFSTFELNSNNSFKKLEQHFH
jgi:hypothetical protein